MFASKIEMAVTVPGEPEISNDAHPSERATGCDPASDSRTWWKQGIPPTHFMEPSSPLCFQVPSSQRKEPPSAQPALTAIWLGYAGTGDGDWTAIATLIRTTERTLAFLRKDTKD